HNKKAVFAALLRYAKAPVPIDFCIPSLNIRGHPKHAEMLYRYEPARRGIINCEIGVAYSSVRTFQRFFVRIVYSKPVQKIRDDHLGFRPNRLISQGAVDETLVNESPFALDRDRGFEKIRDPTCCVGLIAIAQLA